MDFTNSDSSERDPDTSDRFCRAPDSSDPYRSDPNNPDNSASFRFPFEQIRFRHDTATQRDPIDSLTDRCCRDSRFEHHTEHQTVEPNSPSKCKVQLD